MSRELDVVVGRRRKTGIDESTIHKLFRALPVAMTIIHTTGQTVGQLTITGAALKALSSKMARARQQISWYKRMAVAQGECPPICRHLSAYARPCAQPHLLTHPAIRIQPASKYSQPPDTASLQIQPAYVSSWLMGLASR